MEKIDNMGPELCHQYPIASIYMQWLTGGWRSVRRNRWGQGWKRGGELRVYEGAELWRGQEKPEMLMLVFSSGKVASMEVGGEGGKDGRPLQKEKCGVGRRNERGIKRV